MTNVLCVLAAISGFLERHEVFITALATIVIAIFTFTLSRSTKRLWKEANKASEIANKAAVATEKSVELAREEFISTHRPKIIVRGVICDRPMANITTPRLELHFIMANIGLTPATTLEISATLIYAPSNILPAGPPYGERLTNRITVNVGEPQPFSTYIDGDIVGQFKSEDGSGRHGKTFIGSFHLPVGHSVLRSF